VQRDRKVLEPVDGQALRDQRTQSAVGDHVPAQAREPKQSGERVERKDLSAPQADPDTGQLRGGGDGLRSRRNESAVQRTR
jgi:hypothetical protein